MNAPYFVGLTLLLMLVAANAGAEEAQEEGAGPRVIEEIVTIGTRRRERAAVDTAVPVDVFSAEEITSVNSSDLIEVINAIVPSFAARRHPISDGASFIRPTHMRGLDTHHTLGLAARSPAGFGLTLDYYRIRLDDRTVMSSQFTVNPAQAARLIAHGVSGANDISRVRFFVNDVATETSGVDLVVTGGFDSRLGATSLQAAFNFNRTKFAHTGRFVDDEARHDIEEGSPAVRGTLTLRHGRGLSDVLLRARYFGEYSNASTAALEQVQRFGSEVLLDVEAAFTLGERYTLRIGAENILDNYPDPGQFESCCGRIYRSDSIVPWQGRLFYAQLGISFF